MTREEAIDILMSANVWNDEEMTAWGVLIPQLRESEDERIRKALIDGVRQIRCKNGITQEQMIAYLERQKEPIPIPDKFSGLKSLMLQYFDSAVHRNDDAEIESDTDLFGRKILDYVWKYSDEQKEQKPWKVGANAYFTPEQKPAECIEDSVKYEEGFKAGRESGLRDGQKYVLNNLDSYGLCKPAEWSGEDEKKLERVDDLLWMLDDYISDDCSICEERTARLRDEIHKELSPWLEFLRPQKLDVSKLENFDPVDVLNRIKTEWPMAWEKVVGNQEWSEEDKEKIVTISEIIEHCTTIPYSGGTLTLNKEYKKELLCFIKSLRPQYHGDVTMTEAYKMGKEAGKASSWKPSEEQMKALQNVVALTACDKELARLYNQLKKL